MEEGSYLLVEQELKKSKALIIESTLSKNKLHFWVVDLALILLVKYVDRLLDRLLFAFFYPVFMEMILNASLMLGLYDQFIIHVLELHLKSFLLNMSINSEHRFRKIISSVQDNGVWRMENNGCHLRLRANPRWRKAIVFVNYLKLKYLPKV